MTDEDARWQEPSRLFKAGPGRRFLLSKRRMEGWMGGQERAVVRVNTGQLVRKLLLQQPGSSSASSCSGWRRASPGSSQLLLQHGRRPGCRLWSSFYQSHGLVLEPEELCGTSQDFRLDPLPIVANRFSSAWSTRMAAVSRCN